MTTLLGNAHVRLYGGAFLISFSPVFVRLVDLPPTASAFYRVAVGGVLLGGFLLVTRRRLDFDARVWAGLAGASLFFAFDLWFWHRSIVYVGPGLATLLANLQVFFMLAAGLLLLGQRPTPIQVVAAPLAFVGLTLIVGIDWAELTPTYRLGVAYGVLTAASYAGYLLCMRGARVRSPYRIPVREVTAFSLLTALLLGGAAAVEGVSLALPTPVDAGWMLAYGVIAQVLGLIFIASSLANVSATEAGIALLLQPSLSIAWDILLFERPVTALEAIGAAIALGAIFLGARRRVEAPARGPATGPEPE